MISFVKSLFSESPIVEKSFGLKGKSMIDFKAIESNFEPQKNKAVESKNGMIATQSPQASAAGAEILKSGGNAVDAAIAAALTLGVTEPQASGLGGQTMMLIKHARDPVKAETVHMIFVQPETTIGQQKM